MFANFMAYKSVSITHLIRTYLRKVGQWLQETRHKEVCHSLKLVLSHWPYQGSYSTFLGETIKKKENKNPKTHTHTCFFLNVCCVLVFYVFLCCSVCWFLYGPFCHGALKFDVCSLFATLFLWISLQFIIYLTKTMYGRNEKTGG